MQEQFDIVIVGGGILGCASAYRIASEHDVLVLEREQLAASASGAGAGVVSPTLFLGHEPDVAKHCNKFIREFDGTNGFTFTEHPRLELIPEEDDVADQRDRATRLSNDGFPVSYLDAEVVANRHPTVNTEEIAGAIEFQDTGWVDTSSFTTALADAARDRGATVLTGATVTDIDTDGNAVTGVETTRGSFDANTVVAAAGWANPTILPDDISVPVRPYRSQCTVVEVEGDATDSPIWRRTDEGFYARPWDDSHFLVGGGSGALPDDGSRRVDPEFSSSVQELVPRVLKDQDDLEIRTSWAGVAGMTVDGWPIVDETDAVDGLVVVQGAVLGIMGSPAVSKAVESIVADADCPFDPETFTLDRFDDIEKEFAIHSVSSGTYNH